MRLEGREIVVRPGDVLVNSPGGAHSLTNTGKAPIQLVVIDVAVDGAPYVAPQDGDDAALHQSPSGAGGDTGP